MQVSNYDPSPPPPRPSTREALAQDIQTLDATLHNLHTTALALSPQGADKGIPEPLIQYVENGRNPDIYTREFVELVRRMNQLARGKEHAFRGFRDVLAREMRAALPEVGEDVDRVVEATGGVSSAVTVGETEGGEGGRE